MEVIRTVAEVRDWSRRARSAGGSVGLVPTMGALHAGHVSLVEAARRRGHRVVVSIFVNERQFGDHSDFTSYPRDTESDLATCRDAGVDAVFLPADSEMWPAGADTTVLPGSVATPLEGASRPGHFAGVATVVLKLLNACLPDEAFFGQKDLQQVAVVRSMVRDLDVPIGIVAVPTVREPDGLSMSSRNRRLSSAQRTAASCIPRALFAAREIHSSGGGRDAALAAATAHLSAEPTCVLDYLEIVDPDTLAPAADDCARPVMCVAARFGDVRLIDNLDLAPGRGADGSRSDEERPDDV